MRSFLLNLARLLTLSSVVLLAGCSSTDPTTGTTTVSGQVVEAQSRKPVGNGTVQAWLVGKGVTEVARQGMNFNRWLP